jgi:hypothetical protein
MKINLKEWKNNFYNLRNKRNKDLKMASKSFRNNKVIIREKKLKHLLLLIQRA